jgi:hypothetical protein
MGRNNCPLHPRPQLPHHRHLEQTRSPRKGNPEKGIIGWEEVKDMTTGTVEVTITDDTLPTGPHQRTISYQAPFDKCDRVTDYRTAWEFFTQALD